MEKNQIFRMSVAVIGMFVGYQSFSFAGSVYTGAEAVVCANSVRVLDSIEMEHAPINHASDLGTDSRTLRQKIFVLIKRQSDKDLILANKLKNSANELLSDLEAYQTTGNTEQKMTRFLAGSLTVAGDMGTPSISLPQGCKIEQLLIRTSNPLPNQKLFTIRKDLWDKMSLDEQSIAVMHEAIEDYLLQNGVKGQPSTRWYNGMLVSGSLVPIERKTLFKQMQSYGFPYYVEHNIEYLGFSFDPTMVKIKYAEDGSISKLEGFFADLDPSIQFEVIAGSDAKITRVTDVEFDHEKVKRFKILDEDLNIALDQGQQVTWEIMSRNDRIYANRFQVKPLRNRNVVGFYGSTLEFQDNGYLIKNVLTFKWKYNIPLSQMLNSILEETMQTELQTSERSTTLVLDRAKNLVDQKKQ